MSTIDYGNTITSGLVAAYVFTDGNATNLVSGSDTLTLTGDAFFDSDGLNCPNSGTLTGAILSTVPSSFKPNDVTMMWFGKVNGNGTINGNPALAAMYYTNSNVSPFVSYGLHRRNPFTQDMYCLYSVGGTLHVIDMALVINNFPYGNNVNYLLTRTGGATTIYKDGSSIGSDSVAGNLDYGGSPTFFVNRNFTNDNTAQTNTALVFIWNRVLSGGEIATIVGNPRDFLTGGALEVTENLSDTVTFSDALSKEIDNNASAEIDFNLNLNGSAGLSKSGTCTILYSFNLVPSPSITKNSTAEIEFDFLLVPVAIKTIGATAEIDIELEFDLLGPDPAVKLECVAAKNPVPVTATASDNVGYFS